MSSVAPKRPVIHDVARVAGVSVPTVSRVLNGTVPVSPAKQAAVRAAVEQLGYRPNPAALALLRGASPMIGVLALNTTRYGYSRTLEGIQEAAHHAGYLVLIAVLDSREQLQRAIDLMLSQSVAGVVVLEFDAVGLAAAQALPPSIPAVAAAGAGRRNGSHPHAYLDDQDGATLATQYLLDLGHRTVHYLAIPAADSRSGRERGWRRALTRAGAAVPQPIHAQYDPLSGYEAAAQLVHDPNVTAVLCGNDELAIGLMRSLAEHGRDVPGDVSVVGFDDQPFAQMWRPALTTVSQDFVELGRQAFALLRSLLENNKSPSTSTTRPKLIVRESAAAPSPTPE